MSSELEVKTPRVHEFLAAPYLRVLDRGIREFFEGATPSNQIFQVYVKFLRNAHDAFQANARRSLDEVATTFIPSPKLSSSQKLVEQYRRIKQVAIELKTDYLGCSDNSARLDELWLIQLLFRRYGGHQYSSEERAAFKAEILNFTDYQIMQRGVEALGGGINRTPSGTFAEQAMEFFRSIADNADRQIFLHISDVLAAIALCRGTVKKIAPQTIKPPTPRHTAMQSELHCSSSAQDQDVVPPLEVPVASSEKDQLSVFVNVTMKDVLTKVMTFAEMLETQQEVLWGKVTPHLPAELPKSHPAEGKIAPENMLRLMRRKELDSSSIPPLLLRVQICKNRVHGENAQRLFVSQCAKLFRNYKLRRELHVFWELIHPKPS